ncbi:hypothetical protein [Saccharospirillum sp. MSK14-1]|uniref:hypothetical protein n=1 Tax=Saccharospirillum sp. MSK14-1 TaxID=1897632 RepID=UPI0011B26601|nr:hypothetical protein [Saccharospirillum sp. MSK14-1]
MPKTDVNVAANATVTTSFNPDDANNLVDEDTATSLVSAPGTPIIVDLGQVETIKSFTLSRVSSSANFGTLSATTPEILVELSSDGIAYEASNISVIVGDVDCINSTRGQTTMKCEMANGYDVSHIRITTRNGKSYQFTELEAIAEK